MNKSLTPGKIIASLIALGITGFLWQIFFPPGGLFANILLGIFIAIFFVNYCYKNLGNFIDQEFFPKGSKKRARLYFELQKLIKESSNNLNLVKNSKSRQKKIGQKVIEEFTKAIEEAKLIINQVDKEWDKLALISEHEKLLKQTHDNLEKSNQSVFSLHRKWRFLYGMPSLFFALMGALVLREFVLEPYQIPSGSMIPSLLVGDHLFVSKFHYGLSKPFTNDPDFLIKWREPKPGDVVVFKSPSYVPSHANEPWVKRVLAIENQTIQIINNVVYVDDKPYTHTDEGKLVNYMDFFGAGSSIFEGQWKELQALRTTEKIGDLEHLIHMPLPGGNVGLGPYWPIFDTRSLKGLTCANNKCKVNPGHVFVVGDNRANSLDSRFWGALPVSRIKGKALFIWMSADGSGESLKIGPFTLPKFRFERWFQLVK